MSNFIPAIAIPVWEYIRDEMVERGWSKIDLACLMPGDSALNLCTLDLLESQHRQPHSNLGQMLLGQEAAEKLAAAFGTSPEMWAGLDKSFHAAVAAGRKIETNIALGKAGMMAADPDPYPNSSKVFTGNVNFNMTPEERVAARKAQMAEIDQVQSDLEKLNAAKNLDDLGAFYSPLKDRVWETGKNVVRAELLDRLNQVLNTSPDAEPQPAN